MKKVFVFWKGQSKSGNMYIGVSYDSKGFECKKFVKVTDESVFDGIEEKTEIEVPMEALS